ILTLAWTAANRPPVAWEPHLGRSEACSGDTIKETPRPENRTRRVPSICRGDDPYWTLLCLIRMAASAFRSVMLVTAEPTVPSSCNGSHASPAGSGNVTALAFEYTWLPQPD